MVCTPGTPQPFATECEAILRRYCGDKTVFFKGGETVGLGQKFFCERQRADWMRRVNQTSANQQQPSAFSLVSLSRLRNHAGPRPLQGQGP